jgi:hypothetical protein
MAEWSMAHAWKLILLARADAHQSASTHFPINNFRNSDARPRVPVTDPLHQAFRGYRTQS